ncbi:MAG: beta-galactosidase [Phycisphaeraceae bacterium]|jgi:beta-galactosidase|nr:beta-galactosidase [Phycisphaeraceae bacterium]
MIFDHRWGSSTQWFLACSFALCAAFGCAQRDIIADDQHEDTVRLVDFETAGHAALVEALGVDTSIVAAGAGGQCLQITASDLANAKLAIRLPRIYERNADRGVFIQFRARVPDSTEPIAAKVAVSADDELKWQTVSLTGDWSLVEYPNSMLPAALAGRKDVRLYFDFSAADATSPVRVQLDDVRLVVSTFKTRRPITPASIEKTWNNLSRTWQTPHVRWAKPYAGGATRALVIAPRITQREVVELEQRFDVTCVPVMTWHYRSLGNDQTMGGWESKLLPAGLTVNVVNRLRALLDEPFDVIVLSFDWDALPDDIRARIADKVRDGCGLLKIAPFKQVDKQPHPLVARPTDAAEVLHDRPITSLPAVVKNRPDKGVEQIVQSYALGAGRVIVLDYMNEKWRERWYTTSLTPNALHAEYRPVYYEYYQSFLGKALLLAAGKFPALRVGSVTPVQAGDGEDDQGRVAFDVKLAGTHGTSRELTLRAQVVNLSGATLTQTTLKAGEPGEALRVTLSAVPHGEHFVNLWLVDQSSGEERIVDWSWRRVSVARSAYVSALGADQKIYKRGQAIRISIAVAGKLAQGDVLHINLHDCLGRHVATERRNVTRAGDVRLDLRVHDPVTVLHTVTAQLRRGSELVSSRSIDVSVRTPEPEYPLVVWSGSGNTHIDNLGMRKMRAAGVDAVYVQPRGGHGEPNVMWPWMAQIARNDLRTVPYISAIAYHGMGPVRDPCLTNPSYQALMRRWLKQRAPILDAFDTYEYSLGDENNMSRRYKADVCHSPTCQVAFREYLKKEYGDLDALNREWVSAYTQWDQVPIMNMQTAKKHGSPAPWADHHMFKETVLADTQNRFRSYIREKVRGARVGFEGVGGDVQSFRGRDLWKLTRQMDMVGTYPSVMFMKRARSFTGPKVHRSIWMGGAYIEGAIQFDEPRYHYRIWRSLFEGCTSAWYYLGFGSVGAVLTPELNTSHQFDIFAEDIREVKHGIFRLIHGAKAPRPQVALYYSQPSTHADAIARQFYDRELSWFPSVNTAWTSLLDDLSIPFEYISYEQVAHGTLQERGYKVLILPYVQAMSDREVKQVAQFVHDGGFALADVRPGVMSEHSRFVPERTFLADVFGVAINDPLNVRAMNTITVDSSMGWEGIVQMRGKGDELTLLTGKALAESDGGTPGVIVNRHGDGTAILLNFAPDNYGVGRGQYWVRRYLKHTDGTDGLAPLVRAILHRASVRPGVHLVSRDGDGVSQGCSVHPYNDGQVHYAGVVFDPGLPKRFLRLRNLSLSFERDGHLYEVRAGRYLGHRSSIDFTLEPGDAHLYALLPYRVQAISANVNPVRVNMGARVNVSITIATDDAATPNRHIVHVDVLNPDGRLVRQYAGNVELTDGAGAYRFPTALNDPAGQWTVRVKDVVSGATDHQSFDLVARD